jgi:hypothetical protein
MVKALILSFILITAHGLFPTDLSALSGMGSPSQATDAVAQALMPTVNDLIARGVGSMPNANPMYSRKTQAPMVWIHLRKALPIAVDREFYNISAIPSTLQDNGSSASKKTSASRIVQVQPEIPRKVSLVQTKAVDPVMIKNGLYLTMPLRQPPQETVNVAAVEDTRTIQEVADYVRKKRETQRLEKSVTDFIKSLVSSCIGLFAFTLYMQLHIS